MNTEHTSGKAMMTTGRWTAAGLCLACLAPVMLGCGPADAIDEEEGSVDVEGVYDFDIGEGGFGTIAEATQALSSAGFSTYIGTAGSEEGVKPAVDAAGNVYVAGSLPVAGKDRDIFVAKFTPLGALVFFVGFGGVGAEDLRDIAVDAAGNSYVVAKTASYGLTKTILVAKLNAAGNALVYLKTFGGSGTDEPRAIALDSAGNAYLTGSTSSPDFPTTAGVKQPVLRGPCDAFVSKLNAAGTTLTYSTFLGGNASDFGYDIAVDAWGYAFVVGNTEPTNNGVPFPTTPGAFKTIPSGNYDGFVTVLDSTASLLDYSTYIGGSDYDLVTGIAVDSQLRAHVTGTTRSLNFMTTPGAFRSFGSAVFDTFALKLTAQGNAVYYSTFVNSGSSVVGVPSIALSTGGKAIVTGMTSSDTFPVTANAFQKTLSGGGSWDGYLIELSESGTSAPYATYLGGSWTDAVLGVAVDSNGSAYVAGTTISWNFPVLGAAQPTYGGGQDGFVLKIKP